MIPTPLLPPLHLRAPPFVHTVIAMQPTEVILIPRALLLSLLPPAMLEGLSKKVMNQQAMVQHIMPDHNANTTPQVTAG